MFGLRGQGWGKYFDTVVLGNHAHSKNLFDITALGKLMLSSLNKKPFWP